MRQRLMQTQTQQSQLQLIQQQQQAAPASADQLIEQLNEKVKAKDDKGVAALLTAAQTKMAELAQKDPKEAQAYVAKLQQWMQSNSENIKAALKSSGNELPLTQ